MRGAALIIPTFTKGNEQLPASDVDKSRAMSRVRVHVEQTIGVVKRRFAILKGPIPISLLKRKDDVDFATLDKIMVVCAALVNLGNGIVPSNEQE